MDSNNLTEKLNNFTSLVLKDAQDKRDKLLDNVQREYSERLDAKENEYLQDAYEHIQQNIQDSQKDANERVLHAELDAKKKLILRREEIINEVMKASSEKLVEFIKSGEYEEWLLSKIEKALFEVGKGAKTIYISSDDIKLKGKIEQIPETSRLTVEASPERDFIGGAKVLNTDRKVSVDYSFKEMLSEQKQKFLQTSGLALS
ncbi:MAG: V-type ATP synthase subunit E [Oscillospiraceae bacterium]|nr:V-type ATP synthase subunit E [Oscillospiraceae bacterium]